MLYALCVAGAVECVNSEGSVGFSDPALEALDLVDLRFFEPIPRESGEVVSVQGRLRKHASFWLNDLDASDFIKGIILHGYRLPFVVLPWPVFKFNHRSALQHEHFVSSSIEELLEASCIVQSDECPLVCSPLSVVENAKGKLRLVLDLRYVNQFLPKHKFKYEGLNLVPQMFEKGDHFFTFDLKSGYHHVDIHVDFWTYLGFSWGLGTTRKYYMFKVLPFGLASACYVFTKLLRPLVKRWRSKGIRVVVYIDDGMGASKTKALNVAHRDVVVSDLKFAGFVLNVPKSHLDPQQVGKWLGFIIDLLEGNFYVPDDKLKSLKSAIRCAYPVDMAPARCLAKIVGKIVSMSLAIGPVARLRTRALYAAMNTRRSWSDSVMIPADAREELRFWYHSIEHLNGRPIWFSPGSTRIAYSDASDTGYGGYIVELGPDVAHGQWSELESKQSSTWRELKAIYLVLKSFAKKLEGHTVKWFTDNQGAMYIVKSGSRKEHLQEGALAIFELCFSHNIKLEMDWVPRSLNEYADTISRIIDYDDWSLNGTIFALLDAAWGPHTVDCFASPNNKQLARFHSRFWSPGCEAVDTFTVNWGGEVNWWLPPAHLVCRTIQHAANCKAKGTLVVPAWKSAPFWPTLCPDGQHLAPFIHLWWSTSYVPGVLVPGYSGNNLGDSLTLESVLLALFIDFSVQPRVDNCGFCIL